MVETVLEILSLAFGQKGPELVGFLRVLKEVPPVLWYLVLAVLSGLRRITVWWLIPGAFPLIFLSLVVNFCERKGTRNILKVAAWLGWILVCWMEWNLLEATMVVLEFPIPYRDSPSFDALLHLYWGFLVDVVLLVGWAIWEERKTTKPEEEIQEEEAE